MGSGAPNISGSCHCGRVSLMTRGGPRLVSLCHCQSCRKITGTFGLHAFFNEDQVAIAGQMVCYTYPGGSGNAMDTFFCAHCMTRVKVQPQRLKGVMFVPVGVLDDATHLVPDVELWRSEALCLFERQPLAQTSFETSAVGGLGAFFKPISK
jgi:hypothetical protein